MDRCKAGVVEIFYHTMYNGDCLIISVVPIRVSANAQKTLWALIMECRGPAPALR